MLKRIAAAVMSIVMTIVIALPFGIVSSAQEPERVFAEDYSFSTDRWGFENFNLSIPMRKYTKFFGFFKGLGIGFVCFFSQGLSNVSPGVCFGMATTTAAVLQGKPSVSDFIPVREREINDMVDIPRRSNIDSLGISFEDYIAYAHIYQYSKASQEECRRNMNDYDGLYNAVWNYVNGEGDPVIVGLLDDFVGGHEVFAVGIEGDDILINDSNVPRRITRFKRTSQDEWEYSAGGFTWSSDRGSDFDYSVDTVTAYDKLMTGSRVEAASASTLMNENQTLVIAQKDSVEFESSDSVTEIIDRYNTFSSKYDAYWVDSDEVAFSCVKDGADVRVFGDNAGFEGCLPGDSQLTVDMKSDEPEIEIDARRGEKIDFTLTTAGEGDEITEKAVSGEADGEKIVYTPAKDSVSGLKNKKTAVNRQSRQNEINKVSAKKQNTAKTIKSDVTLELKESRDISSLLPGDFTLTSVSSNSSHYVSARGTTLTANKKGEADVIFKGKLADGEDMTVTIIATVRETPWQWFVMNVLLGRYWY